jgi:hypothetical protein
LNDAMLGATAGRRQSPRLCERPAALKRPCVQPWRAVGSGRGAVAGFQVAGLGCGAGLGPVQETCMFLCIIHAYLILKNSPHLGPALESSHSSSQLYPAPSAHTSGTASSARPCATSAACPRGRSPALSGRPWQWGRSAAE